jgi:hypothetical protein
MLAILAMVLSFSRSQTVFAEEDTFVMESFQTVEGAVTDVDAEHKRVTVRWMADTVLLKYEDVLLSVPDSAVITKNSEAIGLDDLESGDHVTVRYDANTQPLPKAVSMVVS